MSRIESIKDSKLTISVHGEYLTLPALLGKDVCRVTGQVVATVVNGLLCDEYGDPQPVDESGELIGWGNLDGPSYRWAGINLPAAVVRHLRKHHDLRPD